MSRRPTGIGQFLSLALLLALLASCGVQPQACPTALLEGELTTAAGGDLVVTSPDDAMGIRVVWEPDHAVREVDGELVLVDRSGAVIAHEGDRVSMGGGFGQGNAFRPCGGITVTPAS